MAFPVTINGRTYTLADFEGTNYVDGFPDALEDFVTQAGDIYNSTSSSSVAIGTGSKTFTVADSGKPYQAGTPLRIADAAAPETNFMDCIVTSYSGTTLVVDAFGFAGSGTKSSWTVNIGGAKTADGTLAVAQGGTGATTAAAAASNLGLGTGDSPEFAGLDVTGTVTADGLTVDGDGILQTSDGAVLTLKSTDTTVIAGDIYGSLQFESSDATNPAVVSKIEAEASGGNGGSNLKFYTNDNTSTLERMSISLNGDISFYNTAGTSQSFFWDASAESLGIGTTTPTAQLHLKGSANANMILEAGSTTDANFIYFGDSGGLFRGGFKYDHSADSLGIYANGLGTPDVTLNSSGKVGIGTTSVSDTLHVKTPFTTGGLLIESNNIATVKGFSAVSTAYKFTIQSSFNNESFSILGGNDYKLITATGFDTPNTLIFHTSNTERLRLDASGQVGIGTSSPSNVLHINNSNPTIRLEDSDGSGAGIAQVQNTDSGNLRLIADPNNDAASSTIEFEVDGSEAMRIDSSGNLLVGTTTTSASDEGGRILSSGRLVTAVDSNSHYFRRNTTDGNVITFAKDGTSVGSISVTASATAYNTSSDQRLKENIVDAPSSSDDIDAIQVRSFDWKADGSHQKYGMIAQELMTVAPEAVSGDPESDEMMGVDYSKLVPMLVKEIQSLRARVAQLETN